MFPERAARLFPVLIALLTLAAFFPVLQSGFINWDDPINFLQNPNYRGLGWQNLRWMWTSHILGQYIPVTWMTLGLDYMIWEMEPFGYHLTNLLLHAANAVLFYFLALALLRIGIRGDSPAVRARLPLAALFAAMVFAIHPLRVESVAWITERRDVVSGLFYLLAVLAYLRVQTPGRQRSRIFYWAAFVLFTLAVLAKPIAVTLPVALLILDVYPLRRGLNSVRIWIEKLPFFAIGIADGLIVLLAEGEQGVVAPLSRVDWSTRIGVSVYDLAFYLWKTVVPRSLAPFYQLTAHRVDFRALPFQLSVVLLLLLSIAAILFRRRIPALLAVLLVYLVTIFPVLGFVQASPLIAMAADRYTYLACLGWAILAAAGLPAIRGEWWRKAAAAAAIAVVLVLAVLTWRQAARWHDSETLWSYAVTVEPSFMAWNSLAVMAAERGDFAGAVNDARRAIALKPDYELAHNNLGAALLNLGNYEEAAREFEIALRIQPDLWTAHNSWGYALLMQGRRGAAIEHFQEALRINPGSESARRNLEQALGIKSQ